MRDITNTKPTVAPLLKRKQFADALGMAVRTVDYLIAAGEIPVVRIGKAIRIRPAALENFIAAREGK